MLDKENVISLSKERNEPEWLLNKRLKAFDTFSSLQNPSFKYGIGINVDMSSFSFDNLTSDFVGEIKVSTSNQAIVLELNEALKSHEEIIKAYLFTILNNCDNKLAFLQAFFNTALFVYIPENVIVETPVLLTKNLVFGNKIEHILVVAEKNSSVKIIDQSTSKSDKNFQNQVVEIIAKENSKIDFTSVQNLSKSTTNFCLKKAFVEKDAVINWLDCCLGSQFTKSSTTSILQGEGSKTKNQGIYFGNEKQTFDLEVNTIHAKPHTTCNMLTKGVLTGKAKTIYRGLIKINPGCNNSEGYQKSDTLLLSEEAEVDPIPNLEINNNDVKCSHGATVGKIDGEKIFYMTSRGISESEAKRLIVEGFFESMIKDIRNELVVETIRNSVSQRLVVC